MRGKLILVVGPSGAGKDTLIDGARAALDGDQRFEFVRRSITRPASAGGEDHESVSVAEFERRCEAGEYFAHWRANGLCYGAPSSVFAALEAGRNVVLNASRRVVADIAAREPGLDVIEINAPEKVLEARRQARGRENEEDLALRRARAPFAPPPNVSVATVLNDQSPELGVERFIAALLGAARLPLKIRRIALEVWREPFCFLHRDSLIVEVGKLSDASMVEIQSGENSIRARLALVGDETLAAPEELALSELAFEQLATDEGAVAEIMRSPSPQSRAALRRKVGGGALRRRELELVVRDLVEGRYSPAETAGFLVAASTNLIEEEIVELTKLRAEIMDPMVWDHELVLDKHSMGGVPGGRVTLVIAPIIAAHSFDVSITDERAIFPKTSSRAITSAAGTADAMEVAARVDLDRSQMRSTVSAARACILWNGKINHSPLDDVMNAINRPLGVSSRLLDVSSILSKKLAAGATHVVVDIPVGPNAKLKTNSEGKQLAELFERVGAGVGLQVSAFVTAGDAPIGRGIGPALELRDAIATLACAKDAPRDLREKALFYAGRLLDCDPTITVGGGRARAEALLLSGAAEEAFQRICAAQGSAARLVEPGVYSSEIQADKSGVLRSYNTYSLAGVARTAGAPSDKSAGIDILVRPGEIVTKGQPLFRVHSGMDACLSNAVKETQNAQIAAIAAP